MLLRALYWTRIINLIIQNYLSETIICIVWPDEIQFALESNRVLNSTPNYSAFVNFNINKVKLSKSFSQDVIDYSAKRVQLKTAGLAYDDLTERLISTIERSHCEAFLAFDKDIPTFLTAFQLASKYAYWRSTRNKFIFSFENDCNKKPSYFNADFFDEQPNILIIENSNSTPATFKLQTNIFVGFNKRDRRHFYELDVYDAEAETFAIGANLFPDKLRDLQGRELIVSGFQYLPTTLFEYGPQFQIRDIAFEDPKQAMVRADGTEMRTLIVFCEIYNCTLEINSDEADDWGFVYPNMSGYGALGMVAKGTAQVAIGAMYSWTEIYLTLDMSMYLVRSGITCLVPAPKRLASWLLPLEPFKPALWAAVVLYLLIEILSLSVAHNFEWRMTKDSASWWLSLKFAIVTTLKLFISQAGSASVITMTVRVILFACFLNDIIVTSIYGGGLASILTIPSFEEAADTLERMHSHQLKWVGNSEAWVSAIRESDEPAIQNILKNFKVYANDELYKLALEGKTGITAERLPFGHYALEEFITEDAIRQLKIMQDDIYFQYTVLFSSRLWPLLERYNQLMYMWHSSGFDKFWEWRIVSENMNVQLQKMVEATMYVNYDDLGPIKLDISNFAGILMFWIMGITIAIIGFFGELLYYHYALRRYK